jgi:uncharacterized membrane protein SpoIIM required for sporulation
MNAAAFVRARQPYWQRTAELVRRGSKRLRKLSDQELRELARLYPALTVDVARARMYDLDATTRRSLNRLAVAAHGVLYRRPRSQRRWRVLRFLTSGYPRLFRRMCPYLLLTTAVFFACAFSAYGVVRMRPSMAYVLLPRGLEVEPGGQVSAGDVSERYRSAPQAIMNTMITTNNIQVAFLAFAMGIFVGIGTLYVLLVNGLMLGTFFAHFANHGLGWQCWSFLTPHGALEIFAILVAGSAGMRLGLSIAIPGHLTRTESLRQGAREAVLLLLGTIPMFIIAGSIEAHVTPTYWPGLVKILIGVGALGLVLAHLLVSGRGAWPAPTDGDAT